MAEQPADPRNDRFFDALRNNPATQRLRDETRGMLYAYANRIVGNVGDSISDASDRLNKAGASGQLPASAKDDMRLKPSAAAESTGSLWRTAGRRARLGLKNLARMVVTRGERSGPVTKTSRPAKPARAGGERAQTTRTAKAERSPATKAQGAATGKKAQPGRATKAQSRPATKTQDAATGKKTQPARATKAQSRPATKTHAAAATKKTQNPRATKKTQNRPASKAQSAPAADG